MKIKSGIFSLVIAALVASCGTSNDVVSGRGGIQKRKYNDGYYISWKWHAKNNSEKADALITEHDNMVTVAEPTSEVKSNQPSEALITEAEEQKITSVIEPTEEITANVTEEIGGTPENHGTQLPSMTKKINKITSKPGNKVASSIQHLQSNAPVPGVDLMTVLLIILAFFLPWLSVLIFEGATNRFWITLILWLIGIGVGFWLFGPGLAYVCALVAVIFAILILLGVI